MEMAAWEAMCPPPGAHPGTAQGHRQEVRPGTEGTLVPQGFGSGGCSLGNLV